MALSGPQSFLAYEHLGPLGEHGAGASARRSSVSVCLLLSYNQTGVRDLKGEPLRGEWPAHHIMSGGAWYPQDLLPILGAPITCLRWCLPGFSALENVFYSFQSLLLEDVTKISTHREKGTRVCLLEGGVPRNSWVFARNPTVMNECFREIL